MRGGAGDTTMPDRKRPIWIDSLEADTLRYYAARAESPSDQRILYGLAEQHDNVAPVEIGGPHGVVRVAITNAYYDARNAGETMETAADNARDGVLRALGMPNA